MDKRSGTARAERLLGVSVIGGFVGFVVVLMIGIPTWPNPPVSAAIGMCFGGAFIGATLAAIAWGRE